MSKQQNDDSRFPAPPDQRVAALPAAAEPVAKVGGLGNLVALVQQRRAHAQQAARGVYVALLVQAIGSEADAARLLAAGEELGLTPEQIQADAVAVNRAITFLRQDAAAGELEQASADANAAVMANHSRMVLEVNRLKAEHQQLVSRAGVIGDQVTRGHEARNALETLARENRPLIKSVRALWDEGKIPRDPQ